MEHEIMSASNEIDPRVKQAATLQERIDKIGEQDKEIKRLKQELEAEKALAGASRVIVQTATDLIKSLKLELAEERAACKIAGHAMDAMRATIERKDEEIKKLQQTIKLWEIKA